MKRVLAIAFVYTLLFATVIGIKQISAQTSCPAIPSSNNSVTLNVAVSETNSYRIWSRMIVPDAVNDSYWLQVDGGCALNIGDSPTLPANQLTWVNFQDGNTGNPVSVSLSAGNHTIRIVQRENRVGVDRLIFTTNTACVPAGTGDNCPLAVNTPVLNTPTPLPPTPTVTPSGSQQTGTGGSLRFDGNNDIAKGVNIPRLTAFTIEAWVKRNADNQTYQAFISDANRQYSQAMSTLFVDGGNQACSGASDQFAYFEKATNDTQCSGVTATVGTWYHVAITRESNGTRRIFINGALRNTKNNTAIPTDSNGAFTLGRAGDSPLEYFAGNLGEVRVSTVARYTTNFTPPTAPFASDVSTILLYHLNEGTGQIINDASGNNRHGTVGASAATEGNDAVWSPDSPVGGGTVIQQQQNSPAKNKKQLRRTR